MGDRPNIILLVMDSARAANLSCYGYEQATTPNIDALAEEGVLFEQAISVGCWTLPVHASLFTGLYPFSHGMTISKSALPDGYPTLTRQLQELGYETVCFSNNAYVSAITGLTQHFDTVDDLWRVSNPRGVRRTKLSRLKKWLRQFGRVTAPIIGIASGLQRARAFMKGLRRDGDKGARRTNERIEWWLGEGRDAGRPFFMFVNYMEPHEPYKPPRPYDRRFIPKRYGRLRVARVVNDKTAAQEASQQAAQHVRDRSQREENLEIIRGLYDGELCYLDQRIGELSDLLRSQNLLDDTVLIVTSDHGESLGEHEHIGHRMTLYEQLVHIPLVIRYPARFLPGTRRKEQVSLLDLYPTLLELAGAEPSLYSANGAYSLMAPSGADTRPFVFAENTAPKSMNSVVARMVRTDRYKFIWKSDQEHELYDLQEDPGELVNLIDRRPDVAQRLGEELSTWMNSIGEQRLEVDEAHYEAAVRDHLRKLGYVD